MFLMFLVTLHELKHCMIQKNDDVELYKETSPMNYTDIFEVENEEFPLNFIHIFYIFCS